MDASTALLVVDVQRAFEDAGYWGRRNNPECEANIAALIGAWRDAGRPSCTSGTSPTRRARRCGPDHPGNAFKDVVTR